VIDERDDHVLGTTSFHDILPAVKRVEIGYTFYARSVHRTHVNTTCKLMMMGHAFDTLGCAVVGWRTDTFQLREPARDRTPGRKEGRRDPRSCAAPRRHGTRHRDVQPARR